ncbi:MAG: phosphatidate cytidylyltransferase, partial [Lachnospiraceae bacterium]|nr:phosphatidate cytidylyltransferase [Lachnospiraceae bacterium]
MKTRVISGAVLLVVFGAACFFGGFFLWILLLAASLIGISELSRALQSEKEKAGKKFTPLELAAWALTAAYYILILVSFKERTAFFLLMLSLILIIGVYVFLYPKYSSGYAMGMYFSVVYIGVCLSCVYLVRSGENGFHLVWLVFISSWICDTGAYFVGCALGKHKLAPVLSPKKTIEGSVGGVLCSAIIGG